MLAKNKTKLYGPLNITRSKPVNAAGHDPASFMANVDLNLKPVSLFHYANVNVSPEGIVFKGLMLDGDLLIYPKHTKTYNFLYLLSSHFKRKKIVLRGNEKYLLCFDYWSNSIFHWMCDALPRIEAVREFAKECILLLPSTYTYPYILETLKAFDFKGIQLMEDDTYIQCQNLYATEQITTSGQMRPETMLNLRQTLLNYFKPRFKGRPTPPNIYISRNKAKYRKVINETALLPILARYKFEIVFFEDLSVCEQVELCYNAHNIVSIHGANLTNVIFMEPGRNVLELRKKGDLLNNYYYELCDSVKCRYFYLECMFEDPEPEKNIFSLNADPHQFEQGLQKLIKSARS